MKQAAFLGGDGYGPSILPGDATGSPLVELVTSPSPEHRMPPKGDGLSTAEIDTLVQWIAEGADWPDGVDHVQLEDKQDHWSFKPLRHELEHSTIDGFVAAKLLEKGLKFSEEASPIVWLRRVTYDLTGLPPTLEEVNEFLSQLPSGSMDSEVNRESSQQKQESAYQSVVDRLLQSDRYGERWGQHWLDVVRYADTHGFEVNTERPNAWPYRDYVICSFNKDTPYDQFIREQIVGDALGQDAATGFLVTASVLLPGQIGKDAASIRLARQDSLDEIVNNISQTFLGLSVGCARCHNHKFDPISARDYYAMQAFVAGVEYEDREINNRESQTRRQLAEQIRRQQDSIEFQLAALSPVAVPKSAKFPEQAPRQPTTTDAGLTKDAIPFAGATATRALTAMVLRPAVGASPKNIDRFHPRLAQRLRFTVLATNSLEPCIDELEIFDSTGRNIALASSGTRLTTSGDVLVANRHDPSYIHDGRYGNESSWHGNETGKGWLEFEFPEAREIWRVLWSRDRQGVFEDRLPIEYRIELLCDGQWELVADSSDRRPHIAGMSRGPAFTVEGLSSEDVQAAQKLLDEQSQLEQQFKDVSSGQLAFAGKFRQPDSVYLLLRGDPEQPKEEVEPAVLSALGTTRLGHHAPETERRMVLADWIADPNNPLTARVMVNRIWQWHFGHGLVATPSDFGRSGIPPSHPDLLDWLARTFIESGWSMKHLHRQIVLSRTFRQSSRIDTTASQVDVDSQWLWRYPTRRREAESLRDSMLFVSGQLDTKMFGPGYDLFNQRGGLSGFLPVESLNSENRRRMIYAHKVRRETEAVFGAFDCPDAGQSTAVRRDSTTPIQALNLMNSRFTLECAELFAIRLASEVGADSEKQIQRAYLLALNRLPSQEESQEAAQVVRDYGIDVLCRALYNCNEFLFFP